MKILILGGTIFLGRHLVDAAISRDHDVTLFNRGEHNANLFPAVEKLRGDRDGNLFALEGRQWDAVIDTCGYVPRIVQASAELLASAVEHYTFISSISVYADVSKPGIDEEGELGVLEDESVEDITGGAYGPLKVLCEQAAEAFFPSRTLNIRPGLIVGPYDPSDRFTYWLHCIARGGEVLAPSPGQKPVQIIDARDLAEWIIGLIEARVSGVYNATGPDYRLTMQGLLELCRTELGSETTVTWVDEGFLLGAGVKPWMDLPLWVAGDEDSGMLAINVEKAISANLTFRSLEETIRDTYHWARNRPADHQWRAGLAPDREQELLTMWHNRR
jgi:2'-hydroxyisoflavone reductase